MSGDERSYLVACSAGHLRITTEGPWWERCPVEGCDRSPGHGLAVYAWPPPLGPVEWGLADFKLAAPDVKDAYRAWLTAHGFDPAWIMGVDYHPSSTENRYVVRQWSVERSAMVETPVPLAAVRYRAPGPVRHWIDGGDEPAAARQSPAPADIVAGSALTDDRNDPRLTHGVDTEPVEQAEAYLVLSDEERARGFVRPVRRKYVHAVELGGCGAVTTMAKAIAETYARAPRFYGGTYCTGCRMHRPVGAAGEFYWDGTSERVGT